MASTFISYQVQFKKSRADKNWNPWCTLQKLDDARDLFEKFKKLRQPTRIVRLVTEVTMMSESL